MTHCPFCRQRILADENTCDKPSCESLACIQETQRYNTSQKAALSEYAKSSAAVQQTQVELSPRSGRT